MKEKKNLTNKIIKTLSKKNTSQYANDPRGEITIFVNLKHH